MKTFQVRVQNGKLVGIAPQGLPDGTELELCLADPGDELTDEELTQLNSSLEAAWRSVRAGRTRPAADVIAELRPKR